MAQRDQLRHAAGRLRLDDPQWVAAAAVELEARVRGARDAGARGRPAPSGLRRCLGPGDDHDGAGAGPAGETSAVAWAAGGSVPPMSIRNGG